MKRTDLYALIWGKPVTHVAKDYGISDVALRKTCIKHGIPMPPLGYWAKLRHGKKVIQRPLPPLASGQSDDVRLQIREQPELPSEVAEIRRAALEEAAAADSILFRDERPANLHPIAAVTEKTLKKAIADDEGFITSDGAGNFSAHIGPTSIDRAIILIHGLIAAAIERGHEVAADKASRILVDGHPLAIRIYETKRKIAHVPTGAELRRQAEQDESRRKYPSLYSGNLKVYRSWDYIPSDRLMLEIFDPLQVRWKADPIVGRWRDTSAQRLEDRLGEMMTALKVGGAVAKHQRAKEAEETRIANEAEARRREQEKQRRLLKRVRTFLDEKAEKQAQLSKLESLAASLAADPTYCPTTAHSELDRALEFVLVNLRDQLSPAVINREIIDSRLLDHDSWW